MIKSNLAKINIQNLLLFLLIAVVCLFGLTNVFFEKKIANSSDLSSQLKSIQCYSIERSFNELLERYQKETIDDNTFSYRVDRIINEKKVCGLKSFLGWLPSFVRRASKGRFAASMTVRETLKMTYHWLLLESLEDINKKHLLSWVNISSGILPHFSQCTLLDQLNQKVPHLISSSGALTFLKATNCLCGFWVKTNQRDKCVSQIKTLENHSLGNSTTDIYALIRTVRIDFNYESTKRKMTEAIGIAKKSDPERLPWIYITLAVSASYQKKIDEGLKFADMYIRSIRKYSPGSWYRFYYRVVKAMLHIERKEYALAEKILLRNEELLKQNFSVPLASSAWTSLFRVVLEVKRNNLSKAKELNEVLEEQVKELPSLVFLPSLSLAIIAKRSGGDPQAELKKAEQVLGAGHVEMRRFNRYLKELD